MSDFTGDRECVTHHYACDCREDYFREVVAENLAFRKAFRKIAQSDVPETGWRVAREVLSKSEPPRGS